MIGQYVFFAHRYRVFVGRNNALTNHDKDDVMVMLRVLGSYLSKEIHMQVNCLIFKERMLRRKEVSKLTELD